MAASTITIPDMMQGAQWPGIASITITINGLAPTYPLASVMMSFRLSGGPAKSTLSSSGNGIIISDDDNWIFEISPTELPLLPGEWETDIRTVDSQGNSAIYLKGILVVNKSVTHP